MMKYYIVKSDFNIMDRKDRVESPKNECQYYPNTFKYNTNVNKHVEKVHEHSAYKSMVEDNIKEAERSYCVCEVCLHHCQ